MDIDTDMQTLSQTLSTPRGKTNLFVMGERKCGKTSLIRKFFENFGEAPETNFLLDSVKSWDGYFTLDARREKISFIEMDVDAGVLDRVSRFEQEMKGNLNILFLIMKNFENSTCKNPNRIKLFFEKLSKISFGFTSTFMITNKYFKKKSSNDTIYYYTDSISTLYYNEMRHLFSNINFYDYSQISPDITTFLKNEIFSKNKIQYQLETIMPVSDREPQKNYQTQYIFDNTQISKKKKKKIFKINKVERKNKLLHNLKFKKNAIFLSEGVDHNHSHNGSKKKQKNSRSPIMNHLNLNRSREEKENSEVLSDLNFIKLNPEEKLEDEQEEEHDSPNQTSSNPNSLISISKEVFTFLKKNSHSKSSSVTEYILENLKKSQTNLSFKNIQRRVYDAINVMNAVGIIEKNKNHLNFTGKINLHSKFPSNSHKIKSRNIKEKIKNLTTSINSRQSELVSHCSKLYLNNKLISLNKNDIKRKSSCDKIGYPFTLIKQRLDAAFVIKQDDLNTRLCILSDKPLDTIDEDKIMKAFLKDDIKNIKAYLKLNFCSDILEYFQKHNLLEKYFNDMNNFNSNGLFLKETYNVYSNKNNYFNSKSKSPIYAIEKCYSNEKNRKNSLDIFFQKPNENFMSNFTPDELMLEHNINNMNSFFPNGLDIPEPNEFIENGFFSNNLSTNYYSKAVKNEEDKC